MPVDSVFYVVGTLGLWLQRRNLKYKEGQRDGSVRSTWIFYELAPGKLDFIRLTSCYCGFHSGGGVGRRL